MNFNPGLTHILTIGLIEGKGDGVGEGAEAVDGKVEPGRGEGQDGSHGAVGYACGGVLVEVLIDRVGVLLFYTFYYYITSKILNL